jgi:hypothetical protein
MRQAEIERKGKKSHFVNKSYIFLYIIGASLAGEINLTPL